MCLRNNRSDISSTKFVSHNFTDLINSGYVARVPFQPFLVNPLSVVTQKLWLERHTLRSFTEKMKIKIAIQNLFYVYI
jgi:hypothetical protein